MQPRTTIRSQEKKYRILIVDDHPVVCHGLAMLIAEEPDLEMCSPAADAAQALRLVKDESPDVLVVDLMLGGENGIDLIQQVKAEHPEIRMLVSSMHDEALFAERALRAGALGYISKQEPLRKIIEAVRQVLRGEVYLSPRMSSRLLQRVMVGGPITQNPIERLSNRELEVFEMIGQGLTTQQIARKLKLSPKTVETHRKKIKIKLNLQNSSQLSRAAFQWIEGKS